jgi:DNA (cytosine-5)-methyltransferase 1
MNADLLIGDHDFVEAPTGLILPRSVAEKRHVHQKPTGVSLFSGVGGFDLGFIQAGFEVLAGVDHDFEASMTYMSNLCRWGELAIHFITPEDEARFNAKLEKAYKRAEKNKIQQPPFAGTGWIRHEPPSTPGVKHFFFGDITQLSGEWLLQRIGKKRGEIGCVAGGPPCQGFSVAGRRDPDDPRNNLVFEFCRLVLEIHPRSMMFENVPGIASMTTPDGQPIMDQIVSILEEGSFARSDALRKVLAKHPAAVAFHSQRSSAPKKRKAAKKAKPRRKPKPAAPVFVPPAQTDLFGESAQ